MESVYGKMLTGFIASKVRVEGSEFLVAVALFALGRYFSYHRPGLQ